MKIYFAGSIRGGRQDQQLYLKIIDTLRGYGEVLTEHVGDAQVFEKEEGVSNEAIYSQDMNWLKQSDVVVAEVTSPSLGVGYEVGIAESLGKPVLCLHRMSPGKQLSAMIAGNPALAVREYKDTSNLTDLREIIEGFLSTSYVGEKESATTRSN